MLSINSSARGRLLLRSIVWLRNLLPKEPIMKKFPKIPIRAGCIALAATILTAACGICGSYIPKDPTSAFAVNKNYSSDNVSDAATVSYTGISIPRPGVLSRSRDVGVYVGGMPFGVKFSTEGVMVVGYGSEQPKNANPGFLAGIRPSDTILKINEKSVRDVSAMTAAVDESGGKRITLLCRRNGKEFAAELTPYRSSGDGRYKTGLLVRDSGAGIGTVTYIIPDTLGFGGLGHGICDSETGALIPIGRGIVSSVTVTGVVKGSVGSPGELHGNFTGPKTGNVILNTSCGVFGAFSSLPSGCDTLMPVGSSDEVRRGDAYIVCSVGEGAPRRYTVKLSDIDRNAKGSKCFSIKVTDPELLQRTGGIVQGMSGSPVIQDGRLIGAVTHVLINDPTSGYGIFIGNMLMSMPDVLK